MTNNNDIQSAGSICFGLARDIDESSLKALCQRFSNDNLLSVLIPRLTDQEINELADNLFSPMKKYFSKEEYHALFIDYGQPEED